MMGKKLDLRLDGDYFSGHVFFIHSSFFQLHSTILSQPLSYIPFLLPPYESHVHCAFSLFVP